MPLSRPSRSHRLTRTGFRFSCRATSGRGNSRTSSTIELTGNNANGARARVPRWTSQFREGSIERKSVVFRAPALIHVPADTRPRQKHHQTTSHRRRWVLGRGLPSRVAEAPRLGQRWPLRRGEGHAASLDVWVLRASAGKPQRPIWFLRRPRPSICAGDAQWRSIPYRPRRWASKAVTPVNTAWQVGHSQMRDPSGSEAPHSQRLRALMRPTLASGGEAPGRGLRARVGGR